jgi:hypothetical protein
VLVWQGHLGLRGVGMALYEMCKKSIPGPVHQIHTHQANYGELAWLITDLTHRNLTETTVHPV